LLYVTGDFFSFVWTTAILNSSIQRNTMLLLPTILTIHRYLFPCKIFIEWPL
jgi:hypothetical protein